MSKQKNAPVTAAPATNTTKFNFTFTELGEIKQCCIVLCDFAHTKFINCRRLFQNSEILDKVLAPLFKENQSFSNIETELNKAAQKYVKDPSDKSNMDPIEMATKRTELEKERGDFNEKKHEVYLYTMGEADFPKDEEGAREKFGQKTVSNSNGQAYPVSELTSFFVLIRNGIIIGTEL